MNIIIPGKPIARIRTHDMGMMPDIKDIEP